MSRAATATLIPGSRLAPNTNREIQQHQPQRVALRAVLCCPLESGRLGGRSGLAQSIARGFMRMCVDGWGSPSYDTHPHPLHCPPGQYEPLEASFSGKPIVKFVIWGEAALLGEEVGSDGNALSPRLCAKLCGLRGGRSFGGRLSALSPTRSLCGCWLRCRATWRPGGRCFPVRGPFGLRPGCGLALVAFHGAR
jgi:hypothetical protein